MDSLSSPRPPQLSESLYQTPNSLLPQYPQGGASYSSSFLTHPFRPAHVVFPLQLFHAFTVQLRENSKTNGLLSSALTLSD